MRRASTLNHDFRARDLRMQGLQTHGLLALALGAAVAGCGPSPAPVATAPPPPAHFEGSYVHDGQRLDISRRDDGYWLEIHGDASGDCAFASPALMVGDRLLASLQNWKSGAVLMVRHATDGHVDVLSEQEDDRFSLAYFCRGGASLAGNYQPLREPSATR